MNRDRRDFLIKAGSATLFGLGSAAALESLIAKAVFAEPDDENPGRQPIRWGMFVDVSKCAEECTACIEACHTTHNVPDFDNPKDEIKWIWKDSYAKVFPNKSHQFPSEILTGKAIPTFCNHCAEPPCVKVCPVNATFKRDDGIVEMDFHRCIGCRYCMAACPYGSRSFNWRDPRDFIKKLDYGYPTREMGVVEKCNFCSERLARNLEPACVATCQNGALVFGNLHDPKSGIRGKLRTRVTFQRKPELGTQPSVFYAFEGSDD